MTDIPVASRPASSPSDAAIRRAEELSGMLDSLSRRNFTLGGLAGAATLGLSSRASAQDVSPGGPGSPSGPRQRDDLLTLVTHASQGYSPVLYEEARQDGYELWLEKQLVPDLIDDSDLDAVLDQLPTLTMTGQELWDLYVDPVYDPTIPMLELRFAHLARSLFTKRQLYERMVEFWTDHFNIFQPDFGQDILKTIDDREVIRKHALGKFPDMLHASARSGAMMWYLDNISNNAAAPNENYAREVLELHTLGVTQNAFTETDVKEFARCLTGWSIKFADTGQYGEWVFYPWNHDNGQKTVLGQIIPAGGGANDTKIVLDLIAAHPATAEHVSRKLVSWLVINDPPKALVDQVKATYLATGGDIRAMVRVALSRSSLLRARPQLHPKLRRPFHYLFSMVRATFPDITDMFPMLYMLDIMGQAPFSWHKPDGFPDTAESWGSGLHPRWSLASWYFDGIFPGLSLSNENLRDLVGGYPQPRLARAINQALMGGAMSQSDELRLQVFIDSQPKTWQTLRGAFAVAASSPSFLNY